MPTGEKNFKAAPVEKPQMKLFMKSPQKRETQTKTIISVIPKYIESLSSLQGFSTI